MGLILLFSTGLQLHEGFLTRDWGDWGDPPSYSGESSDPSGILGSVGVFVGAEASGRGKKQRMAPVTSRR